MTRARLRGTCRMVVAGLIAMVVVDRGGVVRAAALAADDASGAAYADGWQMGDNGGSGFGPWTLTQGANSGFVVGSAAGNGVGAVGPGGSAASTIDTGSPGVSWGLFAAGSETAEALRPLTGGGLAVGQHLTLDFDNGLVTTAGRSVGWGLRAGTIQRFEFMLSAGKGTYGLVDASGLRDTGLVATRGGVHADLALTGPDAYALTVSPVDTSAGPVTLTGTLAGVKGQAIDRVQVFDFDAGAGTDNRVFLNSVAVTPEPGGGVIILAMGAGAWCRRRRRKPARAGRKISA
jgi:hypothetical protein